MACTDGTLVASQGSGDKLSQSYSKRAKNPAGTPDVSRGSYKVVVFQMALWTPLADRHRLLDLREQTNRLAAEV